MINIPLPLSQETIKRTFTGMIFGSGLLVSYAYASSFSVSIILLSMLIIIVAREWPRFQLPWLTPFYPIAPFVLLIALNHSPYRSLLPFLFVVVGCYEVGAYCFGKLYGHHKLWSAVSPGKTWEGAIGGYLASLIAAHVYIQIAGDSSFIMTALATTCLVVTATIGDLFESYLKRCARLKDAGSSLPGHGGFLDRLDGILGAIVLLYPLRAWFAAILEIT
jgi:phosphatidate cytidylyltransferase